MYCNFASVTLLYLYLTSKCVTKNIRATAAIICRLPYPLQHTLFFPHDSYTVATTSDTSVLITQIRLVCSEHAIFPMNNKILLRGTIVNRTYGTHKNQYIFLL